MIVGCSNIISIVRLFAIDSGMPFSRLLGALPYEANKTLFAVYNPACQLGPKLVVIFHLEVWTKQTWQLPEVLVLWNPARQAIELREMPSSMSNQRTMEQCMVIIGAIWYMIYIMIYTNWINVPFVVVKMHLQAVHQVLVEGQDPFGKTSRIDLCRLKSRSTSPRMADKMWDSMVWELE